MKRKYHLNFSKDSQFPSEMHSYELIYQMTSIFYESHESRVQVKSQVSSPSRRLLFPSLFSSME